MLHAQGIDVDGPLRSDVSWMDANDVDKLLQEMEIYLKLEPEESSKSWYDLLKTDISSVMHEWSQKTPVDWHQWYYHVRLLSWLYVIWVLLCASSPAAHNAWCIENISSSVPFALGVSGLEIVYARQGLSPKRTKSELALPVLRLGMELIVTPLVGCVHHSHYLAVMGWSFGELCTEMDLVFVPLGVVGELWMICHAAELHSSALYIAVAFLLSLEIVHWYTCLLKAMGVRNTTERG
ncbi:hypothetical protein FisN_1Lh206 [Fistulifera solaris]|uniref:Uncharacterized protein n=1 Tax=Fistulifera solaris TaxID=1519565 RepID=A0A1Z5K4H3_FISSO|nr:hypothetical protein FisN_1Lh206 [Fistulifera solaris]|eukprot:GAX21119.1 hypothetical protein FisN_1Lh206 [Fistulifera solaris]